MDSMINRLFALGLFSASLAACAPVPPPVAEPLPVAPLPQVDGVAGLQSREPDACHAKDYTVALGQPGSAIAALGVSRSYRVVEYRGIEPQEYDPLRIVFRLDASGKVYNIDCG